MELFRKWPQHLKIPTFKARAPLRFTLMMTDSPGNDPQIARAACLSWLVFFHLSRSGSNICLAVRPKSVVMADILVAEYAHH